MTLRAGTNSRDISPRKPAALFGYPHVERVSMGIHDPLLASALYLENSGAKVVMVALDILFLDPPTARRMRRAVARATGAPEDAVFISCTHTHSAPVSSNLLAWENDPFAVPPDPAWLKAVETAAARAARTAAASARPAELAWTSADATGVGGNRLAAKGLTDPECGVLVVRDANTRRLISVAMIYGMHPTVLHEDSKLVSSDFPHYAREHLRKVFGRHVTVLYHNAPCGNQSPRYFVKAQTFAEAERLGLKLGRVVAASIRAVRTRDWCSNPGLAGTLMPVSLPRRRLPSLKSAERMLAASRRNFETLKANRAPRAQVRTAECAIFGAEGAVTLARAQARGKVTRLLEKYKPVEVQALRIGDACVAGLPGECFTEYALAIKQNAGIRIFPVSLVNGHLQGYITTPEADKAGGYEAAYALFSPAAGVQLVNAILALAGSVCDGQFKTTGAR